METRKASIEEIRSRFDQDVERFSTLSTGQETTIDAPLSLELITGAASLCTPHAARLLDVGCGAGNYSLKMLEKMPHLECTLMDLSNPMLQKAKERIDLVSEQKVTLLHDDVRNVELGEAKFDIVLGGAVFHHLREEKEWESVFFKIYTCLSSGGSFWISDLVSHDILVLQKYFEDRYGQYLETLGGVGFRKKVQEYVAYEDSPRSVTFQMEMLKRVGFRQVEVLHKNSSFAAFGALK